MSRTIYSFVFILFFGLFAIAPVSPSFWLRNAAGDVATSMKAYDTADLIYTTTAMQGSARGKNNSTVLDYYLNRYRPGLERSEREAVTRRTQSVFVELAQQGFAPSQYNNALFHYGCRPPKECYHKAVDRFRLAHEMGDQKAELALALQLSPSKPEWREEKLRLVEKYAARGNPLANAAYAKLLRGGPGYSDEGAPYLEVAAKGGLIGAQEALGRERRYPDRVKWLEAAAEQGSIGSAFALGELYADGSEEVGGEVNNQKAAEYYHRAIHLKRNPPSFPREIDIQSSGLRFQKLDRHSRGSVFDSAYRGAYRLGMFYLAGDGVEQDLQIARDAFEFAAAAPIKDAAVIDALFKQDDRPGYGISKHRRRLGLETLLYWSDEDVEELTDEFCSLIETGQLRAVTRLDIQNWKDSSYTGFDRELIARLESDRLFPTALMMTGKELTLPPTTGKSELVTVVVPFSNQTLTGPPSAYRMMLVDQRATINAQSDATRPVENEQ